MSDIDEQAFIDFANEQMEEAYKAMAEALAYGTGIYTVPIIGQLQPIKCECGSEKLGYSTHSHWCKKYAPY